MTDEQRVASVWWCPVHGHVETPLHMGGLCPVNVAQGRYHTPCGVYVEAVAMREISVKPPSAGGASGG